MTPYDTLYHNVREQLPDAARTPGWKLDPRFLTSRQTATRRECLKLLLPALARSFHPTSSRLIASSEFYPQQDET